MEDIQLQEAIERYLTGDMSVEERTQFEAIRKTTPEIDQMVIEHAMFLREMEMYVNRTNFSKLNKQVFNQLLDAGTWAPAAEQSTSFKVIQLWSKYKKVTAIAASVGGFIALFTSAMMLFFFPSINGNQILELSKAVEKIQQNQKVQGHLLNEVKTKVPENSKLISGGSGFLIDTKGFVITNAHVLKGEGAIVVNSLGQEFKATIVYSNKNSDLALLKIEDEDYKQAKALPFTIRKKSSDLGEDIFTLGFPRNDNDIVYGRGYLSAQTGFNGDSNTYQIQISANPGYSGAPVFNDKNELIGIMSSRQKQAEGVAFAIKSDKLFDLVELLEANELTKDLNVKLNKQKVKGSKNRKAQINNFKNYIYSVRAFD
jgi:S1-C subfamily serine protease